MVPGFNHLGLRPLRLITNRVGRGMEEKMETRPFGVKRSIIQGSILCPCKMVYKEIEKNMERNTIV